MQGISGNKDFDQLVKEKSARLLVLNPLPGGNNKVTWTAVEVVNNKTLTKDHFVTVRDETPHTPLREDIALVKRGNGIYESKDIEFDKVGCVNGCISSFDNCTPQAELISLLLQCCTSYLKIQKCGNLIL